PFSDKRWSNGIDPLHDPWDRFQPFGTPPTKQGDYAYLLHIVRSLKSTGKGACILPHGVLFRGNAEADIRRALVRKGYIKGITGHLQGGIPAADIDALERYWAVCPKLRNILFKKRRPGYLDLAVEKTALKLSIYEHPEFVTFIAGMNAHFDAWRKKSAVALKA